METPAGPGGGRRDPRRSTAGFSEIVVSGRRPSAARRRRRVVAATTGAPVRGRRRAPRRLRPPGARRRSSSRTRPGSSGRSRFRVGRTGAFDAGDASGHAGCARPARLLARAAAPRRSPNHGPGRAASACRRGRVARCADRGRGLRRAVRPDLRPPRARAARRVRLAGRPELPGHARPARADDRAATPASGATSSPTRCSRPILRDAAFAAAARRPRLRRPGRELDDDRESRGASAPWEALMSGRTYYRFPAGAAEVWVLDQRRFKSDPAAPDTLEKTLLGARQRAWLLRHAAPLAGAVQGHLLAVHRLHGRERARRQLGRRLHGRARRCCSSTSAARSAGTTLFLTGDTHLTGVYDADGRFEARAAPLGIPTPNDITLVDPLAAREPARPRRRRVRGRRAATSRCSRCAATTLDLRLVREDGTVPYEKRFTASPSARRRAR